jgi:hypothetical protein
MENFNKDNMFFCFGCTYLLDEPFESECCGYLYCQACKYDFSTCLCPLCKKSMKFRKNLWAKNIMSRMDIKCRHKCGGLFKYEDYRKHLLICPTKKFKCRIDDCRFIGTRKEVDTHLPEKHLAHMLIIMENFDEFKGDFEKAKQKTVDSRTSRTEINRQPMTYSPSSLLTDDNFQFSYYNFRERFRRDDPMMNRVFGDIIQNRYRPSLDAFEQNLNHEEEYAYLNDSIPSEGVDDELFS